jgi:UDP-glucose 4-epimerase
VVVTGGAGYIGSHLVDRLLSEGHHVCAVDDMSTGRLENVRHVLDHRRFQLVQGSILDRSLLERAMTQADLVYHLAALVGVKYVIEDPGLCIRTNVLGTEAVLELACRQRARTVVVSSSEVYGKSVSVPLREDDDSLFGPTTSPRWSYALSKALDEHLALDYARRGLAVSVLRYFNSYGPRLDPKGYGSVVARFITQAFRAEPLTVYGDGQQTRCFTFVDDTVRGTLLAGTSPAAVGQVFNIGSDYEISILELARLIRDLAGSRSDIVHVPARLAYGERFEETRRRVPDVRRAAALLGFRAETRLQDGLMQTLGWFRAGEALAQPWQAREATETTCVPA